MDFLDRVSIGNLNVGDTVKLSKNGNAYADGAIVKAENNKCITYELNDEKTEFKMGTIDTLVEDSEVFTSMNKTQLIESIKILKELYRQMS